MALSNKSILEAMDTNDVVIDPFNRENLGTSSYDVTLGEWYYRETRQPFKVYNIWSEKQTRKVWGAPRKAEHAVKDILKIEPDFEFDDGVNEDDQVILIAPGETIIAHTVEFIGGVNYDTTKMQARSSMGRQFIAVCKCAGWGDVGFFNRWAMEISNASQHYYIPLVVGHRVAQIVFDHTGEILGDNYSVDGKYQSSGTLESLKASWDPELLLPKLYRDREVIRKKKTA